MRLVNGKPWSYQSDFDTSGVTLEGEGTFEDTRTDRPYIYKTWGGVIRRIEKMKAHHAPMENRIEGKEYDSDCVAAWWIDQDLALGPRPLDRYRKMLYAFTGTVTQ